MNLRLSFIALLVCAVVLGKQKSFDLDSLNKVYPDEKRVVLFASENIEIVDEEEDVKTNSKTVEEYLYIKDHVSEFEDDHITYSSFQSVKEVKAYTYRLKKNGRYKKQKVKQFNTTNTSTAGIFYDDQKKMSFKYPSLSKGSKTKLVYEETLNDAHFMGASYFAWSNSALHSEISIRFPNYIDVGFVEVNFKETDEITRFKESKGNYTTYRWVVRNLKQRKYFGNGPHPSHYLPHVVFRVKSVEREDGKQMWLNDAEGLYNWYYNWIEGLNAKEDTALFTIADSICEGLTKPSEKAKMVFNWVQDNIKYVAFEDGLSGFIPREAGLVCSRRYGDCKDMASIITAMLNHVDVKANLTWIGSDDLPYRYDQVPSPIVDNHMIASYVDENGSLVFLDAVGTYTPYGFPTQFIQGKQSMVSHGPDSFSLPMVPVIPADRNLLKERYYLKLEGTSLKGNGLVEAEGYTKINLTHNLINKGSKKREECLERILKPDLNNVDVGHLKVKGIDNRDTTLSLKFDVDIPYYAKTVGEETYLNLNLEKYLSSQLIDVEKRGGIPLKFDQTIMVDCKVLVDYGNAYELIYLPENAKYTSQEFSFDFTYEKDEKNGLVLHTKLKRSSLLIKEDSFKQWNNFLGALLKNYAESIVLKKK